MRRINPHKTIRYYMHYCYVTCLLMLAFSTLIYFNHVPPNAFRYTVFQAPAFETNLRHVRRLSAYPNAVDKNPENVTDQFIYDYDYETNITTSTSNEHTSNGDNRLGGSNSRNNNTNSRITHETVRKYRRLPRAIIIGVKKCGTRALLEYLRMHPDIRVPGPEPHSPDDALRKYRHLPRAIIIGVKKCGTRALLEYLRMHPDIRAPGPEPHFFDRYYHLGLDWYREQMPKTCEHQITMEKTPRYFVNSDAPYRIHTMSSSVRLIIVVRDPVTRAISDFTQGATKQHYLHSSVFKRKAFRSNGTGVVNTHWSIINTGLYAQHLRRWMKYFPLEQMHFVSGENLIANPARELEGVQRFLGIKPVIDDSYFYFNATKGFPCLRTVIKSGNTGCLNSKKGRQHLSLDNDTLEKLRTFYEPYNKEFYNIVGRNFDW